MNGKELEKDLLERLAKLEHDQWVEWSKNIAENEKVSPDRLARWKTLWVPYDQLTEELKDDDRKYAKKVMDEIWTFLKATKYNKAKPMSKRDWETHNTKLNKNI